MTTSLKEKRIVPQIVDYLNVKNLSEDVSSLRQTWNSKPSQKFTELFSKYRPSNDLGGESHKSPQPVDVKLRSTTNTRPKFLESFNSFSTEPSHE